MNPKVVVASLVLVLSLASVASIGVTESWFSDSDESHITVTTSPLEIVIGNQTYNIGSQIPTITEEATIQCNYSVTLYDNNGCFALDGSKLCDLVAGTKYILNVSENKWAVHEVNS